MNIQDIKYGAMQNFDTDHALFRNLEFWRYMILREKEFVNNFRFEGDEQFTREKQRVLLTQCFRFGVGGIVNTEKLIRSKIDPDVNAAIDAFEIDVENIIGQDIGIKVPVGISPNMWDADGKVVRGIGTTYALNIKDRKVYNIDNTNTAMVKFDDNYKTGWWWWLTPAYTHSTIKTVLKKRTTLVDGKLVENKVNNTNSGRNFDSVYDIEKSFIDLSPSQVSFANKDGKAEQINIGNLLETKLKKLDLSNNETINDLMDFMVENEKAVLTEMGKRTNTNEGKNERSISQDFEAMEAHYKVKESEFEDYMNLFMDEYKQIFGVQLTLIVKTNEVIDDLRAKEIEKAGHGKEGKDGTEAK